MLTNKVREKIRKQFIDYNSQFESVNYPTTNLIAAVENKQHDKLQPGYVPPEYNIAKDPSVSKTPTPTVKALALRTITVKDKEVNYSGVKKLNTGLIDKKNIKREVDICIYRLNNIDTKPYLLFNLVRKKDVFSWPTINMNGKTISNVITYIKKNLGCRSCVLTYEGYYTYNNKLQVWFRYSYNDETIKEGKYADPQVWALSSEIINFRKILTFSIDDNVTRFFLRNNDFIYLKNNLGRIYETPIVAYYGNYYKHIAFSATVGVLRGDVDGPLGPYYYFGNYAKAMKFAIRKGTEAKGRGTYVEDTIGGEKLVVEGEGRYTKGGLLRVALFLGKTAVLLNRKEDKADSSDITLEFSKTNNFVKALSKIRDSGGRWTDRHDSVIQGEQTIVIGGEEYNFQPTYAVYHYDQQYPLSYYYVNTDQKNINSGKGKSLQQLAANADYSKAVVE